MRGRSRRAHAHRRNLFDAIRHTIALAADIYRTARDSGTYERGVEPVMLTYQLATPATAAHRGAVRPIMGLSPDPLVIQIWGGENAVICRTRGGCGDRRSRR
ncbi:hypothetical protein [Streptomyces virginiae]|uniref:hypothetical protein n=1 Tax=Streptomyces virginiae TaxID=1961 RepID=UPI002E2DE170|nr:hypothetical protein [Streptomyces virginiae]